MSGNLSDSQTNTSELPVSFQEVDIRHELASRPTSAPNYEREHRAFTALATEMANDPRNMLQKLVEIAVTLCGAHIAGISLLDGDVFRWEAVAGVFGAAKGGTMPRDQSPCGVCIDTDAPQLMHMADRVFPALRNDPRFVEAMLLPFHAEGRPVGTVWIVSHSEDRKFDKEDERIMGVLVQFASAAWQQWKNMDQLAGNGRAKDHFIATLAHELRNPFAAITTAAAILANRIAYDAPAMRAIAVIERQSRHVSLLVADLVDVARVESGKIQLSKAVIDLRGVVTDTVNAARLDIERGGQRVTVDLSGQPVLVAGDSLRLTQITSNLLENASKYTSAQGDIWVTVTAEKSVAHLEVRDTGIGIAPEHLDVIFEPFKQLDVSNGSLGLGIGVALVNSIVRLHGGTVVATSAGVGQGSKFTVRLPLVSDGERLRGD